MRKRVFGKKLSRSRTARTALYRLLTRSLFEHQKVVTTTAKAKGVQVYIEKIISIARRDTIASRRRILAKLANDKKTVKNILDFCKNTKRTSGFTRIVLLPPRKGDNAGMARLELVDKLGKTEEKKEKKGKKEKKSKNTGKKVKKTVKKSVKTKKRK